MRCLLAEDGSISYAYILAPSNLQQGDVVRAAPDAAIRPGNALPLVNMPVGQSIHNIELRPGGGGKLVRAAGTSAVLVSKGASATCVPQLSCASLLAGSALVAFRQQPGVAA